MHISVLTYVLTCIGFFKPSTVPAEWRLQLLDKQEAVRFDRFGYALDNMKHLRAVAWHSKTSKRSHYHAWADFTREATKDREQRKRVTYI
jgi:hypothetical protein